MFNDSVVKIMAELRYCSQNHPTSESHPSNSSTRAHAAETVPIRTKLLRIELTKFDGHRRNWHKFWSQFESSIHSNPELKDTDKFHYLTNLLTGTAASAISGLPITDACYADAVEILKKQFGDSEVIVQDHLHTLINLKPVSSSSDVAELRKLYDKVQVHCRSMKALGTHPLTYCSMLHEIVLQSLPRDIILRYHQRSKVKRDAADSGTTEPSSQPADKHEKKFEDLMTFFGQELECLEAVIPALSKGSKGCIVSCQRS